MKRGLYLVMFLSVLQNIKAQIKIDDSTYSAEQLVKDFLIQGSCAMVSNIKSSTGAIVKGIGYFEKNGTDFPFDSGVVISTGSVNSLESILGAPNDIDLDSAIPGSAPRFDASFIAFDFIATNPELNFDFLFASNEYEGTLPCTYADVFGFLLTNEEGVTKNLAVLPGTEIPVSVTNIRRSVPGECQAKNEKYFDKFNTSSTDAIKYFGQTVVLKATSPLELGKKYTIKLVVSDHLDYVVDSAVFLKGGSFTIGGDLGPDLVRATNTALCDARYDLDLGISDAVTGIYQWFLLNPISDAYELLPETNKVLTISKTGTYKVVFSSVTCGEIEDTKRVEFIPAAFANKPAVFRLCDEDGDDKEIFDLQMLKNEILGTQAKTDVELSFHDTRANAIENKGLLADSFESSDATIFAKVRSIGQPECYAITEVFLEVLELKEKLRPFPMSGFDGDQIVCVSTDGTPITPLSLGQELGPTYEYKWFSEEDVDANSFSEAIYTPSKIKKKTTYRLEIKPKSMCEVTIFETTFIPALTPTGLSVDRIGEYPLDQKYTLVATVDTVSEVDGFYVYQLDAGPFQESNRFEDVPFGDHRITVKGSSLLAVTDCGSLTSELITLLGYPAYFTPNNDGMNETWNISQLSDQPNPITIYNQYGKLVARITTQGRGWDGTYNGNQLPSTDYWFVVNFQSKNEGEGLVEFKGHFSLVR